MKQDLTQFILQQVKNNYNLCADEFSRTRSYNWEEMKILVDKYVKPGMKILDAGCGNGRMLELFKNSGVEYTGIDNSEGLIKKLELRIKNYELRIGGAMEKLRNKEIEKLRNRGAIFREGDVLDLPFEDNKFDVIFCIAVLHHIPSKELRDKAMEELYRVLKSGGVLIMTNWNLWQDKYRKQVYKFGINKMLLKNKMDFGDIMLPPFSGKGKARYHRAFTKCGIKKLFRKSGFEIKECYYERKGEKAGWRDGANLVCAGKKR